MPFQNCIWIPEIGKFNGEPEGSGDIRKTNVSKNKHTPGKTCSSWPFIDSELTGEAINILQYTLKIQLCLASAY